MPIFVYFIYRYEALRITKIRQLLYDIVVIMTYYHLCMEHDEAHYLFKTSRCDMNLS
jgi:hypothetical protein